MSYLDLPRLHFAGTFFSDPSTVNNDPGNFDMDAFDRAVGWDPERGGSWNPDGRHAFRFEGVTVRSAVLDDTGPAADPVVGLRFVTRGLVPAKLVDLDTDQQLVSEIFGLTLALVDAAGAILVEGTMRPAAFTDIWRRGTGGGGGDEAACAAYQSTLGDLRWGATSSSPLLQRLRDAAGDGPLSIKFNLDGYSMGRTAPDGAPNPRFARGRLVGTLGVAAPGEPAHTVLGRQFGTEVHPPGATSPGFRPATGVNYFPGVLDAVAGRVRLDLGNALPVRPAGGPVQDIGELVLARRAGDGSVTDIATIDYRAPGWYEFTAGVVDLPADRALDADEITSAADGTLLLLARRPGLAPTVVEEAPAHVRADAFVARLDPGDQWTVRLHVTRRGQPLDGARVRLFLLLPDGPDAADFPVGGLAFPASVTTDATGTATASLTAADPGEPRFFYSGDRREHVDGQVYLVGYQVEGVAQPNPSNVLSVLVWSAYTPDEPPSWHGSMRELLTRYGNLFPWMTKFGPRLDTAVYEQIAAQREDVVDVLSRDVEDPRYMPVSRDMSTARRKALLSWLTALGPDGRPLLGEEAARPRREAAAPRPAGGPDGTASTLGGKTAAAQRRHIAPR
jgi:hypothetical protein